MSQFGVEYLRRNAYRILGIPSSANHDQIARATRMMQLLSASGAPPTTRNDRAWLGPLERNSAEIERAFMQLSSPETRMRERLWWFSGPPPFDADAPEVQGPANPASIPEEVAHDVALAKLYHLLVEQAKQATMPSWRSVLSEFCRLSASESFIESLQTLEQRGDFERSATREEIVAAAREMSDCAVLLFAKKGESAIDSMNFPGITLVLSMLQEIAPAMPAASERHLTELWDRVEDLVIRQCRESETTVTDAWNRRNVRDLMRVCTDAFMACQKSVFPLFRECNNCLAAQNPERIERIRARILHLLDLLIQAYDAGNNTWSSKKVREQALQFVKPGPDAERLRGQLQAMAQNSRMP